MTLLKLSVSLQLREGTSVIPPGYFASGSPGAPGTPGESPEGTE